MKLISVAASLILASPFVMPTYAQTMTTQKMTYNQSAEMQQDGQILKWVMVVDSNEIALSHEALKRKLIPSVIGFAKFMIKEHSANLKAANALTKKTGLQPIDSSTSSDLKDAGQKELADLQSMDDKAFEKAYINAMVKGHTDVLATINSDLPKVHNKKFKAFLQSTKKHVELHLKKAKAIQTKEKY